MFWQSKTCNDVIFRKIFPFCTCISYPAPSKPPVVFVRAACRVTGLTVKMHHAEEKRNWRLLPVTHHICSLIFFPLSSTVLILKSTPMRGVRNKHVDTHKYQHFLFSFGLMWVEFQLVCWFMKKYFPYLY